MVEFLGDVELAEDLVLVLFLVLGRDEDLFNREVPPVSVTVTAIHLSESPSS